MQRRACLTVIAMLLALLVLPESASAADLVDVSGTVRQRDNTPAVGVQVLVGVSGSDVVHPATSGADGSFDVQIEAQVGDVIEVRATGATVRTGPDERGCVHAATPTGRTTFTIEALPLEPVVVVLDSVIDDTVCSSTATPARTAGPTPPATDTSGAQQRSGGTGWLISVCALSAISLVAARVRPPHLPARRRR